MRNTALCLLNVVLLLCGQLLFKYGARNREVSSVTDVVKLMFSPPILIAVVVYAVATLLWIYILTKIPISYAYPIQALAFPLVVVMSSFLFNEKIPTNRWIGIGIIILGVLVASR